MGLKIFFTLVAMTLAISLGSPTSAYAKSDVEQAKSFVEKTAQDAFDIVKKNKSGTSYQTKALEKMIRSNVDIPWIGQFVMGRFWRQATDAQKSAYLRNYEDFIATTYASRFTEYKGDGFTVTDAREDSENKYTVKMSVNTGTEPMRVDYKVRKDDVGQFKIYDLNVEGVSLITTQRSEFSSILQSKGIDHLIEQLSNKTDSILLVKQK